MAENISRGFRGAPSFSNVEATRQFIVETVRGMLEDTLEAGDYTAKGDLLVASAPGVPFTLPIGAVGETLTVDPTTESGVKWEVPPTSENAVVTALPAVPKDGQEINYLLDATTGIVWKFRYRAGSPSPYKWEFVGGAELSAEVSTAETNSGGSSGAYGALATPGPSIILPLEGDYDITLGAQMAHDLANNTSWMSYDIGGAGAVDADGISHRTYTGATLTQGTHSARTKRKTALAALTQLVCKYKDPGVNIGAWAHRTISAVPVRVG